MMSEIEIENFYKSTLSSISEARKIREKKFNSSRRKFYKTKRKLQCILEYKIRQDIYKNKFLLPTQVFVKIIDLVTGTTETPL